MQRKEINFLGLGFLLVRKGSIFLFFYFLTLTFYNIVGNIDCNRSDITIVVPLTLAKPS